MPAPAFASAGFGLATQFGNRQDTLNINRMRRKAFLDITPNQALAIKWPLFVKILSAKVGTSMAESLTGPNKANITIPGPRSGEPNGQWLKQAKIVGVHPRTVGTYLGLVKYAMTFPEEAIHLLPVRTAGAGNSLYAPVRWDTSTELMDPTLTKQGLDTPDKQLRWAIQCLHAMGKSVGLDIQPHMDRFAEPVFAYPEFFEWSWIDRNTDQEISQADNLSDGVKDCIQRYVRENPATGYTANDSDRLYLTTTSEEERNQILFGPDSNDNQRQKRRIALMNAVRADGYETLPTPMFYHCRPLRYTGQSRDEQGNTWATFDIPETSEMKYVANTRVFGSIAPFKWHHLENSTPQVQRPQYAVWDYYAKHIHQTVQQFGFDFLRADMPYTQLSRLNPEDGEAPQSPLGKPYPTGIWNYVKQTCQTTHPHVGSLAEAFFDPRATAGEDAHRHIDEHGFDIALGNMHYQDMNEHWMNKVRGLNLTSFIKQVRFSIANTVMTADSDKDRFNNKYANYLANRVRLFAAFFLNQPSYMGSGYEIRSSSPEEQAENYSRCYIDGDLKGQKRPYNWGNGTVSYMFTQGMREMLKHLAPKLEKLSHRWLDRTLLQNGAPHVGAWGFFNNNQPQYVMLLNTDTQKSAQNVLLDPLSLNSETPKSKLRLETIFSTDYRPHGLKVIRGTNKETLKITPLAPGEGRIYRVISAKTKAQQP